MKNVAMTQRSKEPFAAPAILCLKTLYYVFHHVK